MLQFQKEWEFLDMRMIFAAASQVSVVLWGEGPELLWTTEAGTKLALLGMMMSHLLNTGRDLTIHFDFKIIYTGFNIFNNVYQNQVRKLGPFWIKISKTSLQIFYLPYKFFIESSFY